MIRARVVVSAKDPRTIPIIVQVGIHVISVH